MTIIVSCHCGSSRIRLSSAPDTAKSCNCTLCSRVGALRSYFAPEEVEVLTAEHDTVYTASGMNLHHFCGKCGNHLYADTPDWASAYNNDGTPKEGTVPGQMPAKRTWGVNMRLAEDFDLASLTVIEVDGRNSW
ncbi:aldehyde-activating protein [Asticcacaulis sp. AC460]|uniref:GFA family protein n=1 Tax=Asticcacaulis sp. AC460 TaxID=1282360 RepID=UPI0003C3B2A0|nr:aldehyde-activating protein [Asticcacaulis sp. AC460]ESQ89542.1 aldehyde-activating protein [Asticcacaulis sp. AC460]